MKKIPVILDCDNTMGVPGCDVDDGLTLRYLLGCPEVELLRRGMILGCGYCRSAKLPQIRDLKTYTDHVYHIWRNAAIL